VRNVLNNKGLIGKENFLDSIEVDEPIGIIRGKNEKRKYLFIIF
jgi:hypothetical protein